MDQNQAALGKNVSKSCFLEHLVLSPSCGQIHSPSAPLPGMPLPAMAQAFGGGRAPKRVWEAGAKPVCRSGSELRTWSRRRNGKIGQAANTKGYSLSAVTRMAPSCSGLHVPDGIGGD